MTLRLTEPVNPFSLLTVIAYVVEVPRVIVRDVGVAVIVYDGAAACTTSCTDVVCDSEPLVPVIVTG